MTGQCLRGSLRSMALDPLKYQERRHPSRLHVTPNQDWLQHFLHGQVTAVSSSSLIMMMPHTHPITAVCCAEEKLENHCFVLFSTLLYKTLSFNTKSLNTQKAIYHCVVTVPCSACRSVYSFYLKWCHAKHFGECACTYLHVNISFKSTFWDFLKLHRIHFPNVESNWLSTN